jgi:hypothetical protein
MKRKFRLAFLLITTVSAAVLAQSPDQRQTSNAPSAAEAQHVIVPLKTFPPDRGGETVSGDPNKPGALFVIRIRNDDGQIVMPHWHPEDEHIVVVKGHWYLGDGHKFDRSALREMKPGDYGLVPKKMMHFAWSEGETVIQVHGIGPFQVLPAADDEWLRLTDNGVTEMRGRLSNDPFSLQEYLSRWKEPVEVAAASVFKYKRNDRVRASKGEGVIIGGGYSRTSNLAQYRIQRADGSIFWAVESDLQELSKH